MTIRHRLLAILVADAVGYSRLTSADDVGTVAALDDARGVFARYVALQSGRIVDTAGDSVLAAFDTAGGAVLAALGIQQHLLAQASTLPAPERMRFRIGLHLGDVIEKEDGTVYGDGVNIAARLQALGPPEGVTVSQAIHDAVKNRIDATFEDLGEQAIKNMPHPIRAFCARVSSTVPARAQAISGGGDARPPRPVTNSSNLAFPLDPLIGRDADVGAGVSAPASDHRPSKSAALVVAGDVLASTRGRRFALLGCARGCLGLAPARRCTAAFPGPGHSRRPVRRGRRSGCV